MGAFHFTSVHFGRPHQLDGGAHKNAARGWVNGHSCVGSCAIAFCTELDARRAHRCTHRLCRLHSWCDSAATTRLATTGSRYWRERKEVMAISFGEHSPASSMLCDCHCRTSKRCPAPSLRHICRHVVPISDTHAACARRAVRIRHRALVRALYCRRSTGCNSISGAALVEHIFVGDTCAPGWFAFARELERCYRACTARLAHKPCPCCLRAQPVDMAFSFADPSS